MRLGLTFLSISEWLGEPGWLGELVSRPATEATADTAIGDTGDTS